MSVIRTDKWLLDSYHKPIEICEKLTKYFKRAGASDIYEYLIQYGMYQPRRTGSEVVKKLQNKRVWEIVHHENKQLQKMWDGPETKIFIFPSDQYNRKLKRDFNGKSGLAFKDKLFLFVAEDNTEKEIRALFTHEYNHVCRLAEDSKNEDEYVLLDTIILEGLAENSVRERFGDEYLSAWTSYYSNEKLEEMWKDIILPNKDISKKDAKHQQILYGTRRYPRMLGYCVGYYVVKKFMEETKKTSKDLLSMKTNTIAQIS